MPIAQCPAGRIGFTKYASHGLPQKNAEISQKCHSPLDTEIVIDKVYIDGPMTMCL